MDITNCRCVNDSMTSVYQDATSEFMLVAILSVQETCSVVMFHNHFWSKCPQSSWGG
jgi:hypothetical protein